ncbi:hypothetical protein C8R47DRAFT_1232242 [Mycena vitilis]|nr:hypothetical protein C8R47DRAFT_1232242 [Mycena vitilis]
MGDFSVVAAASQKQESLNTGNVDTSAATSAPAHAPTPTPVPASTPDPGQQLKASTSPRARHSPRTNPGVLASATRTLVAARSALAMSSSGDFIRLLLEFRPRERMTMADALRQPWLINYIFAYRASRTPTSLASRPSRPPTPSRAPAPMGRTCQCANTSARLPCAAAPASRTPARCSLLDLESAAHFT